jgi:hypothetical protein
MTPEERAKLEAYKNTSYHERDDYWLIALAEREAKRADEKAHVLDGERNVLASLRERVRKLEAVADAARRTMNFDVHEKKGARGIIEDVIAMKQLEAAIAELDKEGA